MVQTSPSNVRGMGLIPSWGAKIPCVLRPENKNIKQKQYCNKFNKDLKKKIMSLCWAKERPERDRSRSAKGQHDQKTASVGQVELVQKGIHYSDAETWGKGSGGQRRGRAQETEPEAKKSKTGVKKNEREGKQCGDLLKNWK